MKVLPMVEDGKTILVLNDAELRDLKSGMYFAMKVLDDAPKGGSDEKLSDRIQVMHDAL